MLYPTEEDKQIANHCLSVDKCAYVKNGGLNSEPHWSTSDIEFTESNGKVIIGYACGAASYGYKYLAEAIYEGTEAQFLKAWFPENDENEVTK